MRAATDANTPLTLVIQRLMDADLLLPDEGSALLAEFEACGQGPDESHEAWASGLLEALLTAGRREASVAGQARAIIHQIFRADSDPA